MNETGAKRYVSHGMKLKTFLNQKLVKFAIKIVNQRHLARIHYTSVKILKLR